MNHFDLDGPTVTRPEVSFVLAPARWAGQSDSMRYEPTLLPDGSVESPDGVVFRRTERKLKRRECADLVSGGVPIMTDVYPAGLEWWDGAEARQRWARIAPLLVGRRLESRPEGWMAHLWAGERDGWAIHFEGWH